jgi:replication factor C subunit 2/4
MDEHKKKVLERFNRLPWIEKYRPHRITSILLEDNVRNEINKIVSNKEISNIIITGRPGIGKTTTIKCLARHLYGQYYDQFVLELNASDDRGIKVENSIVRFCKSLVSIPKKEKKRYPFHKLIILDEADNITVKAQHIISKLMEQYKNVTRFAFTCNTSYNIIEIIQSRCKIIRYQKVKNNKIETRLEDICDIEKVLYTKDGLEHVAELCEGDMRNALNILELTFRKHNKIDIDLIADVYDKPHRQILKDILNYCLNNNYKDAFKTTRELKDKGYTGTDIVSGFFSTIKSKYCNNIDNNIKLKINKIICNTIYNISKGCDTNLQLFAVIGKLCLLK